MAERHAPQSPSSVPKDAGRLEGAEAARRVPLQDAALLATCAFGMGASCLSLAGYAGGVFVGPLQLAFGWSRSAIMLGYSVMTLVTLCTSYIAGRLADLAPPRRIVVPSQIAFGLGYIALAVFLRGDLRQFYLFSAALAVLALGGLPFVFTRVTASRFSTNRGLAFGVISTGSGFCGLTLPPLLAFITAHFGWRAGYEGLGGVLILGALLLSWPMLPRQAPSRATVGPAGGAKGDGGLTLGQATRGYRLWMLALSLAIGAGISTAMVANLIPLLGDAHIGAVAGASALSVFGLAVIVGRLATGALIDRFWAPLVACAVTLPAACALLVLALAPINIGLAYLCAVCLGLATGAEVDMLWYLGARYFGLAHSGRIYAVLYIVMTVGIACASPLFSAVFDALGTYRPALLVGAGLWMSSAAMLLTLGRYPTGWSAKPSTVRRPGWVAEEGVV